MNKITVSVIMPVYNGGKYLHEAITSILNQTFADFEFIIINDGSTDDTEAIVFSFNEPRIIYIKNEYNLKLIKTLNKGVELAKGKYIARMDADDISLPERFERQIEVFNSDKDIDIVNVNAYHLKEDGTSFREQKSSIVLSPETLKYLTPLQNFICHPAVMVKSTLLKHYKYRDDLTCEHIEDFDLWNRMLQSGCICYTMKNCLLYYRDNSLSINHTQKDKQINRMYILCNDLLQERFKLRLDKDVLKILFGVKVPVDFYMLRKINNELSAYILFIESNYTISYTTHREMELWRKQKMILLSGRLFSQSNIIKKAGILIFLSNHLLWFTNRSIRKFVGKSICSKNNKLIIKHKLVHSA